MLFQQDTKEHTHYQGKKLQDCHCSRPKKLQHHLMLSKDICMWSSKSLVRWFKNLIIRVWFEKIPTNSLFRLVIEEILD